MKDRQFVMAEAIDKEVFVKGVKSLVYCAVRCADGADLPDDSTTRRNSFLRSHLVHSLVDPKNEAAVSRGERRLLKARGQEMYAAAEICMKALWDYKLNHTRMARREAEVVGHLLWCLHLLQPSGTITSAGKEQEDTRPSKWSIDRYRPSITKWIGELLWQKEVELVGLKAEDAEAWLCQPLPAPRETTSATIVQKVTLESQLRQAQEMLDVPGPMSQTRARAIINETLRTIKRSGESSQRTLGKLAPQLLTSLLDLASQSAEDLLAWGEVIGRLAHWQEAKKMCRSARQIASSGATKAKAALAIAQIEKNEANYEAHAREVATVFDMTEEMDVPPLILGEAYRQRGWVRMYRGLYRLAVEDLTEAKLVGQRYDKVLETGARHFLGRVYYDLAVATSDKRRMNDALQEFLEVKALDEYATNPFYFRWEALCKEWLGELDEVPIFEGMPWSGSANPRVRLTYGWTRGDVWHERETSCTVKNSFATRWTSLPAV